MRFLLMFFIVMVCGCSTPQQGVKPRQLQQNLLVKCPEYLPEISDGTGGSILIASTEWGAIYHDCATRHNGLVDAVGQ